ncbi:MAG: hypothetical protein DI591_05210 [Citromicrobium sp.]|nr:MAG: hypothetical protein DI591_05210 [Citromicrobium sp.]
MPAVRLTAILALLPALALAACGGSGTDAGTAEDSKGEVLGGSISDAMLPLDTLRSQSAPAEPDAIPEADGSGDGGAERAPGQVGDTPAAAAPSASRPLADAAPEPDAAAADGADAPE